PARRQGRPAPDRTRRPGRDLPGRRVRTDRQPHRIPGPPGTGRGPGLIPVPIERNPPMSDPSPVLHRIQTLLAETLGLPDGGRSLRPDTQLFGAIPELDSLAVLDLLAG